ncbi:Ribonuclease P protein subunit p30 [Vanrija pseudolonga]|uniref:Ribonuclease P protein subunit p30 n=1 Tax=Vanrija pseudolonga TaxID=143232 RepID=A0AAF0YK51_9TREE|nr:Ribonuclease P protein subunit p30 [Vanrija pseudolonga]
MYYDLFVPFPSPEVAPAKKKKEAKGKGKAADDRSKTSTPAPADCWAGLDAAERVKVSRDVALAGHLGYNVVAYTVSAEQSTAVTPCPFGSADARTLPFPRLDPRFSTSSSSSDAGPSQPTLVQVTRYHMRLDDGKVHPITAANTNALADYDILSAYVGSDKAFQVACVELSNPGPNQISIITVPLHERPFSFRLNRKQVRQALRMGVVFEIPYAAGLFPPTSVPQDAARRYRQNFLSNARELVRVTEGKGIILSSGPDGSSSSLRGPFDVVNLATILGIPANLAKEALSLTPKKVLLRAQARRTHKAVTSAPRLVPPPSGSGGAAEDDAMEVDGTETGAKRAAPDSATANKKSKVGA